MRYQMTALRLELGRLLRRRWTWAAFLLVFLFAAAGRAAVSPSPETAVCVGVVLPETGGELFWSGLEARNDAVVSFIRSDEETVVRMVASNRWDCGLLLSEAFEQRLAAGDYEALITLVTGPGSAAYPLVREAAAAVAARQAAPQIAGEYLLSRGIVDESALGDVGGAWLLPQAQVAIELETADGESLRMDVLAKRGSEQVLRGIAALGLMVWMLLTAMDLGRWRESPAVRRMEPYRKRAALLLPRLLGAGLTAFVCGAIGLLASPISKPLSSVVSLVPYLAALGALALLLADTQYAWRSIPTLLPFVVVAGFVLSPVLVDITLLYPRLAPLSRWLPVTLYLQCCSGQLSAAGKLAALAGIAVALVLWRERGRRCGE